MQFVSGELSCSTEHDVAFAQLEGLWVRGVLEARKCLQPCFFVCMYTSGPLTTSWIGVKVMRSQ